MQEGLKGILVILLIAAVGSALIYFLLTRFYSPYNSVFKQQKEEPKHLILLKNANFMPRNLTAEKGVKIIWLNQDLLACTIISDVFSSGALASAQTYNHTFNASGQFDYYCKEHPNIKGRIIIK